METVQFFDNNGEFVKLTIRTNEVADSVIVDGISYWDCKHGNTGMSAVQQKLLNLFKGGYLRRKSSEELDEIMRQVREIREEIRKEQDQRFSLPDGFGEDIIDWYSDLYNHINHLRNTSDNAHLQYLVEIADHLNVRWYDAKRIVVLGHYLQLSLSELLANISVKDDNILLIGSQEYWCSSEQDVRDLLYDRLVNDTYDWKLAVEHDSTELGLTDWAKQMADRELDDVCSALGGESWDEYESTTGEWWVVFKY